MASKKDRLARAFVKVGLDRLLQRLRDLAVADLRIIAYHRVCETDGSSDPELVSASVADFEWQVAHVARHYRPMTFAAIGETLDRGERLPRQAIVITFDDGFRDNYVNAYPVLKRHGVPATFFISSGYIGRRGTFWFNRVAQIVNAHPGVDIELPDGGARVPTAANARLEFVLELLDRIKLLPDGARLRLLEDLEERFPTPPNPDELAEPMSWDEVREMADNGMEFGSHTVSHPILTQISAAQLHDEIHDSKRQIEARLERPIHSISYPEGLDYAYDSRVVDEVRGAGYRFGATYVPGRNPRVQSGACLLRREHIERYTGRDRFAAMLALPELFR